MMKTNNLSSPPRQRTSVAIQGLDRSTPDDLVLDGKCEELHNLRYKEGAWRPVHGHKVKVRLNTTISAFYTIVYHHPTAGENVYVALHNSVGVTFNYYSIILDDPDNPKITLLGKFSTKQKVSHFGNMLMFSSETDTSYFIFRNEYIKFTLPPYVRTQLVISDFGSTSPTLVMTGEYNGVQETWEDAKDLNFDEIVGGKYYASWFPIYNYTQGFSCLPQSDTSWIGEMLIFATYRMEDGTSLSPSPLHLIKSNGAYKPSSNHKRTILRTVNQKEFWARRKNGQSVDDLDEYLVIQYTLPKGVTDTGVPLADPSLRTCTPTVRMLIPAAGDFSLVKSIALWGTRINPIYSEEAKVINTTDNFRQPAVKHSNSFVDYYADNDLANQQFYLITEIDISKLTPDDDGNLYADIILTYPLLQSIIYNTKYTPINNVHRRSFGTSLDYNGRLHIADICTKLANGYSISDTNTGDGSERTFIEYVEVKINNKRYGVTSRSSKRGTAIDDRAPFARIISYPDFRAQRVFIQEFCDVNLHEAVANNFAWHYEPHTEYEKFPLITIDTRIGTDDPYFPDNSQVRESNNLHVSLVNNIFSFPFDNSYSFGSANNRILAMQSAAIEMHEMKVGELPLYVFTEEGIYALVAGQNTLYASVVAINYDKIINPNTLAINGAIVYITEKGVHLLTSQGSQIISQPIHGADGMPPLDFLRRCKIIWPKEYNEFVLLDEESDDNKAYVYNLDAGYWSTRTLQGVKLNTDELYVDDAIYVLADEFDLYQLDAKIVTRPIKLGNVEFKRLETIIPRVQMERCEWIMQIMGAVSPEDYRLLRSVNDSQVSMQPIVIRRTPFSAKYFKLTFDKLRQDGVFAISHIDFEWYERFKHRMR